MIGDCPKCGDRMVALFQTPKCERCELGGAENKEPVFYAVMRGGYREELTRYPYVSAAIFQEKKFADIWAGYIRKNRSDVNPVVVPVKHASSSDRTRAWYLHDENGLGGVLKGSYSVDANVCRDEASAEKERFAVRFLLVKP